MTLHSLLRNLTYWWVGTEWTADIYHFRMVRRRPDRTLEFRPMTPEEWEEEARARAW